MIKGLWIIKFLAESGESNLEVSESYDNRSWNRGLKETYKLITYSGYELEATADHKILTVEGYKKINELKKGDEILIQPFGKFQEEIGFLIERKETLLDNKFIDKVESIEYAGQKEVYDFNEPISNSFIANGLVIRNCGEQPLLPYEACNLGSINLAQMIMYEDGVPKVDYEKLKKTVHISVRFLDDVIDMSKYPLDKIRKMVDGNRKVGLGIMGWADMLTVLGIPYNSEQALELAKEVMSFIQDESKIASRSLAEERGSFPNFKGSIYDNPEGYEIRNATTTTIAPTGTLSIIANCSSGIEPIFALSFVKNVMDNDKLVEVNPYFERAAKQEGFFSEELMEEIARKGSIEDFESIPSYYKRVFVTAHEVAPIWHVRMQATFQEFVDNAVSKTVNFSNSATENDVEDVFMLAYRLGCKGITIYRDGSRESQVLQVEGKNKGEAKTENKEEEGKQSESYKVEDSEKDSEVKADEIFFQNIKPRPRPDITKGVTRKYSIGGCGKIYVTVNSDELGICEVFTSTGEEGCAALSEAVSRLISITLRSGIDIDSILKQIEGIRCITCIADENTHVLSCPDAIGKAIEFYLKGPNKFDLNIAGGSQVYNDLPGRRLRRYNAPGGWVLCMQELWIL